MQQEAPPTGRQRSESPVISALDWYKKHMSQRGYSENTIADLNKAIQHHPHEWTYYARGVAYMYYQNQLDSAEKDFQSALKLNARFTMLITH